MFSWRCTHCGVHGTIDLHPAIGVWLALLGKRHLVQSPHCDQGVTAIALALP